MSASAEARELLAPSGRLRVGMQDGRNQKLAQELASQLRVSLEPTVFESDEELYRALKRGQVDVAILRSGAIDTADERRRATPFLREFVDDARLREIRDRP